MADSTDGKINKGIASKMDTPESKKAILKDVLKIGAYELSSRLLVGTGKYKDLSESHAAIEASGAAAVTVAIRRINAGQTADAPDLLDVISPEQYVILPKKIKHS